MALQYPFVIGGIPEIPLSDTRAFVYAATDGREGVPDMSQFKVTANNTDQLSISPGVLVCKNAAANALGESYTIRNSVEIPLTVIVPPTATSIRYDLVYIYLTDPDVSGGSSVGQVARVGVLTDVGSTRNNIHDVPGYETVTGYTLAKITRGAGRTTVQNTDLIDVRDVLTERTWTKTIEWSNSDGAIPLTNLFSALWPPAFGDTVVVPDWASTLSVSFMVTGLELGVLAGPRWGTTHLDFVVTGAGGIYAAYARGGINTIFSDGSDAYHSVVHGGSTEWNVQGYRGQTLDIHTYAYLEQTGGAAGGVTAQADYLNISATLTFASKSPLG